MKLWLRKLKHWKQDKKLSSAKLADMLNVSESAVSLWLSGYREPLDKNRVSIVSVVPDIEFADFYTQ